MMNVILVLTTVLAVFNFITWFFNRGKIKSYLAEEKKEWEQWMKELQNTPVKPCKTLDPSTVFNWAEMPPFPEGWNTPDPDPEARSVPEEYWKSLAKSDRQAQSGISKYFVGYDPITPPVEAQVIRKVYATTSGLIEEMASLFILEVITGNALEATLDNVRPGNVINIIANTEALTEDKGYNQKTTGFNWDYEFEFYINGKTYLLEGDGFYQNTCKFSLKL